MKIFTNFFVLFILILGSLEICSPFINAGEKGGEDEIVASIEKRYKTIHSLKSNFIQQNFIASLNQSREFQGRLSLSRPYLFAMEVSSPSHQSLIFDGQFFWIHTSSNNQVLKNPVDSNFLDHPLINLLTTMADLKKKFFVSLAEPMSVSDYSVELTLKDPKMGVRKVHLTVTKKDFQIKELTLYYDSGNYTRIALKDVEENPDIPPERFQCKPPPGTEILENSTLLMQPY